ncbi:modular serine protease [Holotrichia oblita]|uniref:Modular serine protease n=1 Tax=Holotrichia oblita TaxID=644536 RepID=A0ACB9SUK6_HOLOL|nr:modular serine protease [Holotrichia oblita]
MISHRHRTLLQRIVNNCTTNEIRTIQRRANCNFVCDSGVCLDLKYVCDGVTHCRDGSDETSRQCADVRCPSYLFRCAYGACITRDKLCDGISDCADNSDEIDVECRAAAYGDDCRKYEFKCSNGQCINNLDACDGKVDCEDGSDETEQLCGRLACPAYLFRCSYGACLLKTARCNGIVECADNSDEEGCETGAHCAVPAHPNNAFYYVPPIDMVDSYVRHGGKVFISCDRGYYLRGKSLLQCLNGAWMPSINESYCARTCPAVVSDDIHEVSCSYNNQPASCEHAKEGTVAYFSCKDPLISADANSSIVCQSDGEWSQKLKPCIYMKVDRGCLLPPHPRNGKYKLIGREEYLENSHAHSLSALHIMCDNGYVNAGSPYFFCIKNVWTPELSRGHCLRTCPPLYPTDTYDVRCELNGQSVDCEKPIENTIARLSCMPYYKVERVTPILKCQNGEWDPSPIPCQPECGQKTVNVGTLIINGNHTLPGEYPWIAAIYIQKGSRNDQVCSGSLISRFFILSAAHCFTYPGNAIQRNPKLFTIAAGKYYRNFNINETGSQIRKIKKLFVHEDYRGKLHGHRDDIALVEVEPFQLSETVQLICIDWSNFYESIDFQDGKMAVTAGFGFTRQASSPAETLQKLVVPYRSMETCEKNLQKKFYSLYYVSDKICAGYRNENKSICTGDSGGGLYFPRERDYTFFIRGIASLTPISSTGCDSNEYSLYTKVSRYLDWIQDKTRRKL